MYVSSSSENYLCLKISIKHNIMYPTTPHGVFGNYGSKLDTVDINTWILSWYMNEKRK